MIPLPAEMTTCAANQLTLMSVVNNDAHSSSIDYLSVYLVGLLTDWLVGWLASLQTGWLPSRLAIRLPGFALGLDPLGLA